MGFALFPATYADVSDITTVFNTAFADDHIMKYFNPTASASESWENDHEYFKAQLAEGGSLGARWTKVVDDVTKYVVLLLITFIPPKQKYLSSFVAINSPLSSISWYHAGANIHFFFFPWFSFSFFSITQIFNQCRNWKGRMQRETIAFSKWVYPHTLTEAQKAAKKAKEAEGRHPRAGQNQALMNEFFQKLYAGRAKWIREEEMFCEFSNFQYIPF